MKKILHLGLALCALTLVTFSIVPAGAKFINYQGTLESGGEPVTGETTIIFNIYEIDVGGTPMWTEQHTKTLNSKGKFHVKLGSIEPFHDTVFYGADRWIGITVVGDPNGEMDPRTELGSVPFALLAQNVPDTTIGTKKIKKGAIVDSLLAENAIDSSKIKTHAIDSSKIKPHAIDSSKIKPQGVDSTRIKNKTIGHDKIKNKAIVDSLIANDAIVDSLIKNGTIKFEDLGQNGAQDGYVMKWTDMPAPGEWYAAPDQYGNDDNDWSLSGNVLSTAGEWGIGRFGNTYYGPHDSTHINFGVASSTGTAASDNKYITVGGGINNIAIGDGSTIGGGKDNTAGSMEFFANGSTVGGGVGNHASGGLSFIGGGQHNRASGRLSVVCGGGGETSPNDSNSAAGDYSVVVGGARNISGDGGALEKTHAFVGGGYKNKATGAYSTIAGGYLNEATGDYATVPGGYYNKAEGNHSFAAGNRARANLDGSVVIAANMSNQYVTCGSDKQMVLQAPNYFYLTDGFGTMPHQPSRFLNTSTGAYLDITGTWTNNGPGPKENFTELDGKEILEKIAQLSIIRWDFKKDNEEISHIAPNAEEFHRLFGVGSDDNSISSIDPSGIALIAIQELYIKTQRIDQLENEVKQLSKALARIEALEARLETLLSQNKNTTTETTKQSAGR